MDINTCFETTKDYHEIVYYTHLIPIFLTLVLTTFALRKTNYSLIAKSFAFFSFTFCLWFVGSLITWTFKDYNLVAAAWAPLDYINVAFYILGLYFFIILIKESDINLFQKILLLIPIIPAWLITVSNNSIGILNQPVCEASNNDFLTQYKLWLEIFIIGFIMFYGFFKGRKAEQKKKIQILVVSFGLVLFFAVFAVTEYIGSITGLYEMNFYNLFILPVFLFIIIFATTNLEVLKMKLIGSQLLAYALVIMVGSQLFFLESTTSKALTIMTFIMSLGFGVLLVRSGRREAEAREKVEKLAVELEAANEQLKELDRQKDELLGLVSHQLATPVSGLRWNLEMIVDGDLGELNPKQKEEFVTMQGVVGNLSDLVSMILDVSRIQLGRMKVDKVEIDLKQFYKEMVDVLMPKAHDKKIDFTINMPENLSRGWIDKRLTHMTIENLMSNAIKYTPDNGKVTVDVTLNGDMMKCVVKDNGMGIPKKDQEKIFGKLYRASNVGAVDGNGFGLYVAKGAIEAQGGKIWFESAEGKGTTFFVELPIVKPVK